MILTEVSREPDGLSYNKNAEGVDWSVVEKLLPINLVVRLLGDAKILPCPGYVDLFTFH